MKLGWDGDTGPGHGHSVGTRDLEPGWDQNLEARQGHESASETEIKKRSQRQADMGRGAKPPLVERPGSGLWHRRASTEKPQGQKNRSI